MKITALVWLEAVDRKIHDKHGVSKREVKDVFAGRVSFRFIARGNIAGEHLYAALGRTAAGRYLTVFFIYKRTKEALIVTARDMAPKERKRYAKRKA